MTVRSLVETSTSDVTVASVFTEAKMIEGEVKPLRSIEMLFTRSENLRHDKDSAKGDI